MSKFRIPSSVRVNTDITLGTADRKPLPVPIPVVLMVMENDMPQELEHPQQVSPFPQQTLHGTPTPYSPQPPECLKKQIVYIKLSFQLYAEGALSAWLAMSVCSRVLWGSKMDLGPGNGYRNNNICINNICDTCIY